MSREKKISELTIEDARLIFRNFAGKESQFNRLGDRNFNVVIPPEEADNILSLGWNVKVLDPREEGDEPTFYLPVAVGYKGAFPPRIVMITSTNRVPLSEDTVQTLDYVRIVKADVTVRPFNWEAPGGKSGVKAYLKTMFVTIEEDYLEKKYGFYDGPISQEI